jgi:mRNA-degrading endonuclease toxin of MazEF toxin-antitoxin module
MIEPASKELARTRNTRVINGPLQTDALLSLTCARSLATRKLERRLATSAKILMALILTALTAVDSGV